MRENVLLQNSHCVRFVRVPPPRRRERRGAGAEVDAEADVGADEDVGARVEVEVEVEVAAEAGDVLLSSTVGALSAVSLRASSMEGSETERRAGAEVVMGRMRLDARTSDTKY